MKYFLFFFLLFPAVPVLAFETNSGTYSGNAADNRSITGVGFFPDYCMIEGNNGQTLQYRTRSMSGDATGEWRGNSALTANVIQRLESDGFQVGTDADVNSAGITYEWTCIRDNGDNDFEYGTYSGNGADDRTISLTKMNPVGSVWTKDGVGTQTGAWRIASNSAGQSLQFHEFGAEQTNQIQDFGITSNIGTFEVGTSNAVNLSGSTYYYIAFAHASSSMGFREGKYTGDGVDSRIIRTQWPVEFAMTKESDAAMVVGRGRGGIVGDNSWGSSFTAFLGADRIQSLTSSNLGFEIGTNAQVNGSTLTYYWLALRDTPERVKIDDE